MNKHFSLTVILNPWPNILYMYYWKYWHELVGPQITIAKILVYLNLAVWYEIAIRTCIIYASMKHWWVLIWQLQG